MKKTVTVPHRFLSMQLPARVVLEGIAALEASTGIKPLKEYFTYVCCNESKKEPHYVPRESLERHLVRIQLKLFLTSS